MQRAAGILMPISSLPSPYGIGTLGKAAYDFADFLEAAGQKYWQVLPVGPTSYGDSPYSSFSSFAGNPYFIDLDMLIEDGLLTHEEAQKPDWGDDPHHIDYGKMYENRFDVLRLAVRRGLERDTKAFDDFVRENAGWLIEYALFMACKKHFGMLSWIEWPEKDIRTHQPEAVNRYKTLLRDDIIFYEYLQFLFTRQWEAFRAYVAEKDIQIIGDLPIYAAMDSADVWSEPEWFQLDEENIPTAVAGVPPDYFSEDGQLWGNPLYRWDRMRDDGFGWWIRRIDGAFKRYDVLRFDHFRGLESYWAVPYGEKTAKIGEWIKGPDKLFVQNVLCGWFRDKRFIAEDLGYLTPEVRELLAFSHFPGMKVLEFAFDWREPSDYLPHTYDENCVCYTGTHDNATLAEWFETAAKQDIKNAIKYMALTEQEGYVKGTIRAGMGSVASLFVAQMQDYLGTGAETRINTPGTVGDNWRWRMDKKALTKKRAKEIAALTALYGR